MASMMSAVIDSVKHDHHPYYQWKRRIQVSNLPTDPVPRRSLKDSDQYSDAGMNCDPVDGTP